MRAKKFIGFFMAIIMCLGIVTPMSAFAEDTGSVAGNLEFVYEEGFEKITLGNRGAAAAYKGGNGWATELREANGVTAAPFELGNSPDGTSNKTLNYVTGNYVKNEVDQQRALWFRLLNSVDTLERDLTEDFVLSFKFYPKKADSYLLIEWQDAVNNSGSFSSDFKIEGGYIYLCGNKTNGIVPANTWSTIDIVYDYDDTVSGVNSISARLNGVPVYYTSEGENTYSCATSSVHGNIDHWRIYPTKKGVDYGADTNHFSIDDWRIMYGNIDTTSPYWYEWYDDQADDTEYFRNDFDGTDIPTDATNGGERVLGEYLSSKGGQSKIEDGVLYLTNTGALGTDGITPKAGGMYEVMFYADKTAGALKGIAGDITVSYRIRPNGNFESEQLMAFRCYGFSGFNEDIYYGDGKAGVDGMVMSLSTTEFNVVEMMFNYDWEKGYYESIDFYVNGHLLGSSNIIGSKFQYIDHFRTLNAKVANTAIDVDFVNISKGHKSLYNAEIDYTAKTEYVGYQATKAVDNKFNLRLVGVMTEEDYFAYKNVGFKVKVAYGETVKEKSQDITKVYEMITATEGCDYTEYTAEELGGAYIFALNCKNIPSNQGVITFEVTTYYQLNDDSDTFYEKTVKFTVDPTTGIPKPDAN